MAPGENQNKKKKCRIGRVFAAVLFSILLLLLLAALSVPSLLSTDFGRKQALKAVNSQIEGTLAIEKLQLSWFGNQGIQGLELKDAEGHSILSFANLDIPNSLFELLTNRMHAGKIEITDLNTQISQAAPSINNIQKALSPKDSADKQAIKESAFNLAPIVLKGVNLQLSVLSVLDPLTLHFHGQTLQDDLAGEFDISATAKGWNSFDYLKLSPETEIKINAKVKNFPVALFDQLVKVNKPDHHLGMIAFAFGSKLDLSLEQTITANEFMIQVQAETPFLNIQANLESAQTAPTARLKFQAMTGITGKPFEIKLDMEIAQISDANMFLANLHEYLHFQGKITGLPLTVADKYFELDNVIEGALGESLDLEFATVNTAQKDFLVDMGIASDKVSIPKMLLRISDDISLDFSGKSQIGNQSLGSFQGKLLVKDWVKAGIFDLKSEKGFIDKDKLTVELRAKCNQVALPIICKAFNPALKEKAEALFGTAVDADLQAEVRSTNGSLLMELKGENGQLLADVQIKDGVLLLNKPLEATVKVTPQLGKHVLKEVIPLLGDVVSAENPLKISIGSDGFSLPVHQFELNKIEVNQAQVLLGKVQFKGTSQLSKILNLLKPAAIDQLSVWFTPLDLQVIHGVVKLDRLDMLVADHYPVALWGKVDLPKDKVNMVIGLTPQALMYAFNLKGLDKNYMMQIPFKGKIGDASIDKTQAAARISALIAQKQGGTNGMLLGTVLEIAGGALNEDNVPPTKQPLPWDTEPDSSTGEEAASSEIENPPMYKENGKPIADEIEKGAKKLLKKLFH